MSDTPQSPAAPPNLPPADNGDEKQPPRLVAARPPRADSPTIIPPVDEAQAPAASHVAALAPAKIAEAEAVPLGESVPAASPAPSLMPDLPDLGVAPSPDVAPSPPPIAQEKPPAEPEPEAALAEDVPSLDEAPPSAGGGQPLPPPVTKMPPKDVPESGPAGEPAPLPAWLEAAEEAPAVMEDSTAAVEAPATPEAPPEAEPQFTRDLPPAAPVTAPGEPAGMPESAPPGLPPSAPTVMPVTPPPPAQAVVPPAPVEMPAFAEAGAPQPFGPGTCPRCGNQAFGSGQLVTYSGTDFRPGFYKPARFSLRRLRNALRPFRRLVQVEAQVCRTCGLVLFQVDVDRLEQAERRTGDRE